MVCEDRRVEQELCVRKLLSVYVEAVGHQRVPVVELAELQRDAVPVLEMRVKQQGGVKLQLQKVAAQVLHILLYHDSNRLACRDTQKAEIKFIQRVKSTDVCVFYVKAHK